MGKTAHTPGPWRHYKRDGSGHLRFVCGPHPRACALARIEPIPTKYLETETIDANARLIAAAPDLLEALEAFASHYPKGINPMLDDAAAKAHAAIARAKGEA